jgi:hypothetical protein
MLGEVRAEEDKVSEFEDVFRNAGLPMMIDDYHPSMETFQKASPLFGAVSMLELLILSTQGISWLVVLLACLVSGIGFIFLPRLHKFVPGGPIQAQLVVFIIFPAVLSWFFAGLDAMVIVIVINLMILGLITAGSGYGMFAIVIWTSTHLLDQLRACIGLLSRAIPLLMIFSLLVFVTTEIWETVGVLSAEKLIALIIICLGLGVVFLIVHLPEELEAVKKGVQQKHPMKSKEQFNLILVLVVGQMVQALVVGAAVTLFFTMIGLVMIDNGAVAGWSQEEPQVLFHLPFVGDITQQLVSVTVFLGAFTSFYFTVAIMTDDVYRKEFGREVSDELQIIFTKRDQYLDIIEASKNDSKKNCSDAEIEKSP